MYVFPKFQKCQLFWHSRQLSLTAQTTPSTVASSSPSTCAPSKNIRISAATHATKSHQNNLNFLGKKYYFWRQKKTLISDLCVKKSWNTQHWKV